MTPVTAWVIILGGWVHSGGDDPVSDSTPLGSSVVADTKRAGGEIRVGSSLTLLCLLGPLVQVRAGADIQVMADGLQGNGDFFVHSGQLARGPGSC